MTRAARFEVRCTEAEKREWTLEANSQGLSVGELVRRRMYDPDGLVDLAIEVTPEQKAMVDQYARARALTVEQAVVAALVR
jgi:hypothetical protein